MNRRTHLAIVAAVATLFASTALGSVYQGSPYLFIFDRPNWFWYVFFTIATVLAATTSARALRAPVWLQPVAGAGGLLLFVTVVFGQGDGILAVIPTPGSFDAIGNQISFAFREIAELSAPVPLHLGLLLLAVLGVGAVAVVVDFLAVSLQRASLAGLPLLVLYAVPVSIDRDGLNWFAFALGAAGYLWLLVTDQLDRVQRWGRPFQSAGQHETWSTSLGSTGRWVGLGGIVIAAFLPMYVPAISTEGWLGGGSGGNIGPGGRSVETINPITQLRGQLNDKREVELLRLRTNDSAHFYLRVTTLDQYGTIGWTQRQLNAKVEDQLSRGIKDDDGVKPDVRRVTQKTNVEIRAFTKSSYLPIFSGPTKASVRGDWRWEKKADTAFSTRVKTRDLKYSFDSKRVVYDPDLLAAAPNLGRDDQIVKEYTGVGGGAELDAQGIVNDTIRGKNSQYEKVMAILDYFSVANHFVYSQETKPGTSGSDLMDFLNNRRGYCEQYASAMAYMVRAAGIPARVAVGFSYGTVRNGYTSITNHDAHAWVEVYFSGLGWVPFDPTPPGGPGNSGGLSWTQRTTGPDIGGRADDPDPKANDPQGAQPPGSTDKPEKEVDDGKKAGGAPKVNVPTWSGFLLGVPVLLVDGMSVPQPPVWVWWLLGGLVVLAAAAVPGLWRLETRRLRLAGTRSVNPLVAAHSAWDEVLDTLTDVGLPVADAETPRAIARQLADHGFDEATVQAAWLIAAEEEAARYAPRSHLRRHPSGYSALATATILVCRALMARGGRRTQVKARLLPPSLVRRTGMTASIWAESVSVWFADVRFAAGRLLPERRANRSEV